MKKFGIDIKQNLRALRNEDYKNINYFFNIIRNEKEVLKRFSQPTLYSLKLCGKEILFVINLDNENKNKNKLIVQNFFDEQIEGKIVLGYEGQYYKITPYIWLKNINIENVLNYDRNIVEKSINKCILNDIIADNFNQLLLSYILAYDRTKDENYYEIAMEIANKLVEFDEKNHVYMINKLQLCRRKRNLKREEIIILQDFKEKKDISNVEAYCIAKILDNKADIEYYFNNKLTEKEREELRKYPITNLK